MNNVGMLILTKDRISFGGVIVEFAKYNEKVQEKTEKLILILFSLYSMGMCALSVLQDWEQWVTIFIIAGMIFTWGIFVFRIKNYSFRAAIVSLALHICVCFYACRVTNLFPIFALILSVGIIMALYGISELMWINIVTTLFLLFYHGVIVNTMKMEELIQSGSSIFLIFSVFLAEYMIYFWVKKRNENTEQFFRLIKALQNAERSKDDFLANVSHEIRTPVNTICGMSELALEEEDPQKIKEAVFDIQIAGRNLLSVVSDVLDFSELQSGKMEIEEEEYNITSTINDIINLTMARKNQKKLELIVDCNATLPSGLMGDEKKLRRIIMNVLNNAIKFTNEGGVNVIIDYRREEYGINLIVTVKDTGIGMQEENIEKLFTSFNQVDTKRNRQEGGLGLGLAITQALVEKMGGVLNVRSKIGKGTTVKVVIPQKIVDERPVAYLERMDNLNLATYIDMEQFNMRSIRDAYSANIKHMVEQMQVRCQNCRNLAELKRRTQRESFSHIFISIVEYLEDPEYFDALAKDVILIVILDQEDDKKLTNDTVMRLYKPFYILPIVQALNRSGDVKETLKLEHRRKFVAPDVKVLVVDDNEMNIRVIEGLLERYKIKVARATSGHEALNMVDAKDYDFIFMDHMMPEMDGVETLHRIRDKKGLYFREVPIVVLTANAIAGSRERLIEEGFNDFVEKPVETSVLERVLLRTISPLKVQYIEETTVVEKKAENIVIGDLDVEKGLMYCGGKEKYLLTLAEGFMSWDKTKEQIEVWYEAEDWKNYTIGVHALKSSMLSIGAVPLSEMAKALEMAGRNENVGFIQENHREMIEEFQRVIEMVEADPQVPLDEVRESRVVKKETVTDKENATEELLNQWLEELEDAAFSLDGTKMLSILTNMSNYCYGEVSLEEPLQPVMRKVEMSDLMSAFDVVCNLCEEWKKGGAH